MEPQSVQAGASEKFLLMTTRRAVWGWLLGCEPGFGILIRRTPDGMATTLLPPETLERISSAVSNGDHSALLAELPALHKAVKESPEAQRHALVSSIATSTEQRQQADIETA